MLATEGNNMSGTDTANKYEAISTEGYRRYCRQIDKEDELIDRRVNWLLTSQAILFAAVGLSGNGTAGIVLSVVPWVGLWSSLAIGVSVWAASLSLTRYRNKLMELCPPRNDSEQQYPQLHREGWIIMSGLLPTLIVPLIFSAAWIAVILMKDGAC